MRPICGTASPSWGYDMGEEISRILRKYGMPLEVLRDGKWEGFRGFLQPATSRSWQNMERQVCTLGEVPGGMYVFIGPVGAAGEGDTLRLAGTQYLARRMDTVYYGDQAVYSWGLCSRKGGEDTWGS